MAWDTQLQVFQTITATGNGTNVEIDGNGSEPVELRLDVKNVSGTSPTLDAVIQESEDGTNFTDIVKLPQITGAVVDKRHYLRIDKKFVRISYTVTGTSPSFDVEVRFK